MKSREERAARQEQLLDQRERVEAQLLVIPGVRAVGVGLKEVAGRLTEEFVFRVYVETKRPASEIPAGQLIPELIEGIPTDVLLWKPARNLVDSGRYRPLLGGIQIGNGSGAVGTLGCLAQRNDDASWVSLSNHHVMFAGKANVDPGEITIAQPTSGCCCCCVTGLIGRVISGSLGGLVDCAIASIDADIPHIQEIVEVGGVTGTASGVVGDAVRKRGRTTRLTSGIISEISLSISNQDGVAYTQQMLIAPDAEFNDFVLPGDSGSALVNEDDEVVGLIWGSRADDGIANHIRNVETALDITVPATGVVSVRGFGERQAVTTASTASGGRVRRWERLLQEELEADHPLSVILRRHQAEVWDLVQHDREVGARWQRSQGPAFVAAFQRTTRKVDYRVPAEISGVSLSQLMLIMAAALERSGSQALREDLRQEAIAWIPRLQGCHTADALWREYQVLKHEYRMMRI